jgi:hypothetical protein
VRRDFAGLREWGLRGEGVTVVERECYHSLCDHTLGWDLRFGHETYMPVPLPHLAEVMVHMTRATEMALQQSYRQDQCFRETY